MGWWCPPMYGKHDARDQKKIDKLNRKIESLKKDKAIYEERIAKRKSSEESKKN